MRSVRSEFSVSMIEHPPLYFPLPYIEHTEKTRLQKQSRDLGASKGHVMILVQTRGCPLQDLDSGLFVNIHVGLPDHGCERKHCRRAISSFSHHSCLAHLHFSGIYLLYLVFSYFGPYLQSI